jgi:hypothetical protein
MPKHVVSYSKYNPSFNLHAVNNVGLPPASANLPTNAQMSAFAAGIRVKYYLHCNYDDPGVLAGSVVISVDGLCPPFDF